MTVKIGINGFGRIGRLALRAAWQHHDYEIVHINEIAGDAQAAAHLLKYDSVHGTWDKMIEGGDGTVTIDAKTLRYSQCKTIA